MGNESDLIREGNKQQDNPNTIRQSERGKSAAESWNSEASKANNISAIDGKSIIYIDHRWAQNEYNNLSPEAKEEVDTNVNNIFTMRNSEFVSGKKLDANNLEHRPYIALQSRIRDELMTWQKDGKTGKEYWEAEVNNNRELRRDIYKETTLENTRTSATDSPTGASESSVTSRGEVDTTPRQNRIWPEEQAMTGKKFKNYVTRETTIYGGRKTAAFLIAEKLKPGDLNSRAMKTPEGLAGLRALNDAMNPEGISGAFTGLSENEMKEKTRIAYAIVKIDNELHPPVEYEKGKQAFDENFPRYAEELKKGIEKNKNYQVERVYHQPFTAKGEQIRAVVLESRELTDRFGETHTLKDRKDICLGGVDLTRKGAFIDAKTIETHGTVRPSALQADDILGIGAAIGMAGKYLMKGALKGVGRLAATEGASAATTLSRELGEDAIERGVRGVDAFAPTQRITRIGDESVDALGQTQRAARIEPSDSPVDALAKTERIDPADGFNEAAATQRITKTPAGETPPNISAEAGETGTRPLEPTLEHHDTIQDGTHSWESSFKEADAVPEKPLSGDVTPEPTDMLSGQTRVWDNKQQGASRLSTDNSPGVSSFESEIGGWRGQPADHGYDNYLGRPLYAAARDFGMNNEDLINYIDKGLWPKESSRSMFNPAGVRESIQRAVMEDLVKLEGLEAKNDIRRAIQHGDDPRSLVRLTDDLEAKGFTGDEIRSYLQNRNNLLDQAKQDMAGQDMKWHLRTNAGPYNATKSAYFEKERAAFLEADSRKPDSLKEGWPGPERMKRWYDEASKYADRLWNRFMN